jgi:hypothetical protein
MGCGTAALTDQKDLGPRWGDKQVPHRGSASVGGLKVSLTLVLERPGAGTQTMSLPAASGCDDRRAVDDFDSLAVLRTAPNSNGAMIRCAVSFLVS